MYIYTLYFIQEFTLLIKNDTTEIFRAKLKGECTQNVQPILITVKSCMLLTVY